jgi:hypothetical protein
MSNLPGTTKEQGQLEGLTGLGSLRRVGPHILWKEAKNTGIDTGCCYSRVQQSF